MVHWYKARCVFEDRMNDPCFQRVAYGEPHRLSFNHPKIGKRVWQYCPENLTGAHILCYRLTSEVTNRSGTLVEQLTLHG